MVAVIAVVDVFLGFFFCSFLCAEAGATFLNTSTAVCEPGWILHAIGATTYCYKVERLARTWNAARKQCQWLNADLLSISGPEEQAFVNKHLLSSYFMWIGYNDQNQEGVWRWTDG